MNEWRSILNHNHCYRINKNWKINFFTSKFYLIWMKKNQEWMLWLCVCGGEIKYSMVLKMIVVVVVETNFPGHIVDIINMANNKVDPKSEDLCVVWFSCMNGYINLYENYRMIRFHFVHNLDKYHWGAMEKKILL